MGKDRTAKDPTLSRTTVSNILDQDCDFCVETLIKCIFEKFHVGIDVAAEVLPKVASREVAAVPAYDLWMMINIGPKQMAACQQKGMCSVQEQNSKSI